MTPNRSVPVYELSTNPVVQRAVLQARADRDAALRSLGRSFAAWVAGLRRRRPSPAAGLPLERAR